MAPQKYTEARKEGNKKWDAANLDRVSIAMPKGMKDEVKAAAESAGESMNQYINGAISQRMSGKAPEMAVDTQEGRGGILTPSALQTAQEAAQKAGETVPAFVERAVETQAQRDKTAFALELAKKKNPG